MAKYVEKKVSSIINRRDFLKVAGIGVSVIAVTGYAITDIVKKRKSYISMRQEGLYNDDKRLQKVKLTASHNNPSAFKAYRDLNTEPMGKVAHELLHTDVYVDRANLV